MTTSTTEIDQAEARVRALMRENATMSERMSAESQLRDTESARLQRDLLAAKKENKELTQRLAALDSRFDAIRDELEAAIPPPPTDITPPRVCSDSCNCDPCVCDPCDCGDS